MHRKAEEDPMVMGDANAEGLARIRQATSSA